MRLRRSLLLVAAAAAVALAAPAFEAVAQPAGAIQAINPMTRDLGSIRSLSVAVPATYNSVDQSGFNVSRITCVYNQSAKVGSTLAQFTVQGKDAASGLYYTLIQSATPITNTATANVISVGAGLPNSANVSAGLPIPATWRVQVVITNGTSVTATTGCTVQ